MVCLAGAAYRTGVGASADGSRARGDRKIPYALPKSADSIKMRVDAAAAKADGEGLPTREWP